MMTWATRGEEVGLREGLHSTRVCVGLISETAQGRGLDVLVGKWRAGRGEKV